MQSDERILTTHCGSLPRPAALSELLLLQEAGEPIDQQRLHHESSEAVAGVLRAQVDAGIDIVSDGEQPRVGFSMYVPMRMAGFGGNPDGLLQRTLTTFHCSQRCGRPGKDAVTASTIRRGPLRKLATEAVMPRAKNARCSSPRSRELGRGQRTRL